MWQDEQPESDPGVVYALVGKGRTTVFIVYSGPAVTGDPRELDLPIGIETLFSTSPTTLASP